MILWILKFKTFQNVLSWHSDGCSLWRLWAVVSLYDYAVQHFDRGRQASKNRDWTCELWSHRRCWCTQQRSFSCRQHDIEGSTLGNAPFLVQENHSNGRSHLWRMCAWLRQAILWSDSILQLLQGKGAVRVWKKNWLLRFFSWLWIVCRSNSHSRGRWHVRKYCCVWRTDQNSPCRLFRQDQSQKTVCVQVPLWPEFGIVSHSISHLLWKHWRGNGPEQRLWLECKQNDSVHGFGDWWTSIVAICHANDVWSCCARWNKALHGRVVNATV